MVKRVASGALLALVLGTAVPLPAGAEEAGPAVTVAPVANACLEEQVFFTGLLVPREEVLVMPLLEGAKTHELLVEEGERVTSGQVIARLRRGVEGNPAQSQTVDVTSPVDGRVLRRGTRIGAVLAAAQEPMFRLARGDEVEVEAEIPEVRLGKIAEGQPVRIEAPGVGEVSGRVRHVAPEIDRQTRLGRIRIAAGTDTRLRLGGTVTGSIETGRSCGLVVPVSALITRGADTFVQRVRDNRVETRPVRLGLVEGARVEVKEGLNPGDQVVARAGAFLRDGDPVRPLAAAPGTAPAKTGELRP